MSILPRNTTTFEEIVKNFAEKGRISILEQLRRTLEEIDLKLCSERPKTLKCIKIKERTILTELGLLTFRRRYYYDELQDCYLYLLDHVLKIPYRSKIMNSIKLKAIEAASEMSYSKAAKYGAPTGFPISKASVCRYIKKATFHVKENLYLKDNDDIIHLQMDEKFLNTLGYENKKKYYTATIFKGRKKIGKKDKIQLVNRTLISASTLNTLYKKINKSLLEKYKVKPKTTIYLSGDLATYIQNAPEKIFVCNAKYVPDKYHVKQALLDELGVVATDKELANKEYINDLIESLKDAKTVNGMKLFKLVKDKADSLKTYTNKNYFGCSQEGMNSHYYASRFGKLPMKIGKKALERLSKIIEAKQNGSIIEAGFKETYYPEPYDVIGHCFTFENERYVLDTRGMKHETRKIVEQIKYSF